MSSEDGSDKEENVLGLDKYLWVGGQSKVSHS